VEEGVGRGAGGRKSGPLRSACMCAHVWAHGDRPHGRFRAGARKFEARVMKLLSHIMKLSLLSS
jgi:hypothetical protein